MLSRKIRIMSKCGKYKACQLCSPEVTKQTALTWSPQRLSMLLHSSGSAFCRAPHSSSFVEPRATSRSSGLQSDKVQGSTAPGCYYARSALYSWTTAYPRCRFVFWRAEGFVSSMDSNPGRHQHESCRGKSRVCIDLSGTASQMPQTFVEIRTLSQYSSNRELQHEVNTLVLSMGKVSGHVERSRDWCNDGGHVDGQQF